MPKDTGSKEKSSKDKEKSSSKDRDKSSLSSSSKDKEKPSSSSKDKEKGKEKEKPLSTETGNDQSKQSRESPDDVSSPAKSEHSDEMPMPVPTPRAVLEAADSCESCGKNVAVVYCQECDLKLCRLCDANAHLIDAFRSHTRAHPSQAALGRMRCKLHPASALKYFCESCSTPVCADCRVFGAHQGHSHFCISVVDAYRTKVGSIQQMLNTTLLPKRDALVKQIAKLEAHERAIRNSRMTVEREIMEDVDGMLGRLRYEEQRRLAILHAERQDLLHDVDAVQDFVRHVATAGPKTPNEMHAFLSKHKEMAHMCNKLACSSFRTDIDVPIDGFINENAIRIETTEHYETLERLVALKDQMIQRLLQERLDLQKRLEAQSNELCALEQSTQAELSAWTELTDKYSQQLGRFQMKCRDCLVPLSAHRAKT